MNPYKNYVAISMSEWQMFDMKSMTDDRYRRKVQRVIETHPSEKDWEDYRAAKEAREYLLLSPYFRDGGPDDGSEVEEPRMSRKYIYAESEDEWLDRCRDLLKGESK